MFQRLMIKEDKEFSNAQQGKETFFLPNARAISSLVLTVKAMNAADHNTSDACMAETILEAISDIRVETGSRVFKQFDAQSAYDLATYRDGTPSYLDLTQVTGGTYPSGWQEVSIPINFGRFPEDRVCGLPAPLYPGLQMSIDYDFDVLDTGGTPAAAFLTGTDSHTFSLYASTFPDLPDASLRAMKVICDRKRQDYTTKAKGVAPINLSSSNASHLRQIMVSAYLAGSQEGELLSKLTVKASGKDLWTGKWNEIQRDNADKCGLQFDRSILTMAKTTDDQYYSRIPDIDEALFSAKTTTSEDAYLSIDGDKVTINSQTADDEGLLRLGSSVIPTCAIIDFDENLSMKHLLPMNLKKLQLEVVNAGAGGAVQIYEQTVEPA